MVGGWLFLQKGMLVLWYIALFGDYYLRTDRFSMTESVKGNICWEIAAEILGVRNDLPRAGRLLVPY